MNLDILAFKKSIEDALKSTFGVDVSVERAEGSFIFVDAGVKPVVARFKSNEVFVAHLTDMDVNQWVEEFRSLLTKSNSFGD
jgi:hypothetical protein